MVDNNYGGGYLDPSKSNNNDNKIILGANAYYYSKASGLLIGQSPLLGILYGVAFQYFFVTHQGPYTLSWWFDKLVWTKSALMSYCRQSPIHFISVLSLVLLVSVVGIFKIISMVPEGLGPIQAVTIVVTAGALLPYAFASVFYSVGGDGPMSLSWYFSSFKRFVLFMVLFILPKVFQKWM